MFQARVLEQSIRTAAEVLGMAPDEYSDDVHLRSIKQTWHKAENLLLERWPNSINIPAGLASRLAEARRIRNEYLAHGFPDEVAMSMMGIDTGTDHMAKLEAYAHECVELCELLLPLFDHVAMQRGVEEEAMANVRLLLMVAMVRVPDEFKGVDLTDPKAVLKVLKRIEPRVDSILSNGQNVSGSSSES